MTEMILDGWPLVIQGVLGAFLILAVSFYLPIFWGAPFIPASWGTARKMLALADVKPGQTVVDLGAGDGRLVILAARAFGAKAIGVEIDPTRWLIANIRIWQLRLRGKAAVRWGDLWKFDPTGADVVILYLTQGTNRRLQDRLLKTLSNGARVVTIAYSMSGWTPTILDDQNGIFVYEIGQTGEETVTKFR
jgi:predicted RNA methylase